MKQVVYLILIAAASLLTGCQTEPHTSKTYSNLSETSKIFRVQIDVFVPKDDHFSLYYTTDGSTDFLPLKIIWREVKGSKKLQRVSFALPQHIKPTQLRIDLGNNPDQDDIILRNVQLSYAGKAVDIPGTLIFSYFRPDFTKTTFDASVGKIRGIMKNGIRQSPSLYPKEGPLSEELKKIME